MTEPIYLYIVINTYSRTEPPIRQFFEVTNLQEIIKYEHAPAYNVNSFEYTGIDGKRYVMEKIIGEVTEKVKSKELDDNRITELKIEIVEKDSELKRVK